MYIQDDKKVAVDPELNMASFMKRINKQTDK